MKRTLVIVESPAKAKTIGRYLGEKYRIAASVGHIRDLPSTIMGVDTKKDFAPTYIPMKGKDKIIKELRLLAESSENVLIATDPDREGEAIAWHIATILKINPADNCRISFNEITEASVKQAVTMPRPIDMNLVNAQQARRILDRLVGYELSPLLWSKIRKGLSAGRVQSVATRMVVDREEEINRFTPEEYWNLTAMLNKKDGKSPFKAYFFGNLEKDKVSKIRIRNEEQKNLIVQAIGDNPYSVYSVKKGNKKRKPYAPYTTSTLQQDASRALSYSSKKTMSVAQQLYEGIELGSLGQTALVTYIRTDSVRSSSEAVDEIRNIIRSEYGDEYAPLKPKTYSNKNKTQDAHEAIRPAHFDIHPDKVENLLSRDQYRLYKLIWNRFMASQMADASVDTVTADIETGGYVFRAAGETIVFPGYLILYKEFAEEKTGDADNIVPGQEKSDGENPNTDDADDEKKPKEKIPELSVSEPLVCDKLNTEQKFTLPPARYTEASLIKSLEEEGIGRPSTYAPTISTVIERNYIEKNGKYLIPTQLGTVVTGMLKTGFENIVDLRFTAEMENRLDTVEMGEKGWVALLSEFYPGFHQQILEAAKSIEKVSVMTVVEGEVCPECGGELHYKEGKFGKFIACANYPKCKYTRDNADSIKAKCPLCGSGLLAKTSAKYKNNKFYVCDKKGSDPECPFISWDIPLDDKTCSVCGKYMVLKRFGRRTFPKCSDKECESNKRKTPASEAKEE
ncbi:MAG: type I DNA topoisomerase [Saccharofermentanales bacterium]